MESKDHHSEKFIDMKVCSHISPSCINSTIHPYSLSQVLIKFIFVFEREHWVMNTQLMLTNIQDKEFEQFYKSLTQGIGGPIDKPILGRNSKGSCFGDDSIGFVMSTDQIQMNSELIIEDLPVEQPSKRPKRSRK